LLGEYGAADGMRDWGVYELRGGMQGGEAR
jgi:hypothetical protein